MIGFAGWADHPVAGRDDSVLEGMLARLAHRGTNRTIGSHARLTLGSVGRPGAVPRRDGPIRVELDGRLSFAESPGDVDLDGEAPERGAVRAYEAWGPDFLRRAVGEFALALWDEGAGRLLLARDPAGVKPLYYCRQGSWIAFASEIKSLLAHPRVPREIDRAAVAEYVGYRYVSGAGTLFREIRELEPGWRLVWQDGQVALEPYWDLPYGAGSVREESEEAYADRLDAVLDEATRECLDAGGRVGVLLSGGLDSSLLTALAARRAAPPLRTWSVGTTDDRLDEGPRAEFVARALGTRHVNRRIGPAEFAAALPEAIALNDEPLHHPCSAVLLLVARDAASETEALIMGEGAGSTFGDRTALKLRLAETLRGVAPRGVLRLACDGFVALGVRHSVQLRQIVTDDVEHFTLTSNLFTPLAGVRELLGLADEEPTVAPRRRFMETSAGWDPLSRLFYYYQKTAVVANFNVGKMLTAAGVEARMPFGSRCVQELSCRIPSRLKASLTGRAKPLIVRVCRRYLPAEVLSWRKMGFGFPIGEWLRRGGALEPYVQLLLEPRASTRGIFRPQALARVIEENERGVGNHGEGALWAAVNLELWARIHLEGRSPADVRAESVDRTPRTL